MMVGYCKIDGDLVNDVEVILRKCRHCRHFVPSTAKICFDYKPVEEQ
jgi:hypothetical protein